MWGSGGPGGSGPQWSQQQQWSFNPNSYANVAHDQVDWAALAQQWIQMKDVATHHNQPHTQVNMPPFQEQRLYSTPPPPPHPPPPSFSNAPGFHIENNLVNQSDAWTAPPPVPHQHQQHHSADAVKDDWNNKHDVFPAADSQYNTMFQQSLHHQQTQNQPPLAEEPSNYWNSPMSSSQNLGIKFPPSVQHDSYDGRHQQQQQQHHHHHHHHHHHDGGDDMSRSHQELDAIRRKQLPAWIREGLEKVEREKRRKQEKEEQDALKEQMREANKAILSEQVGEVVVAPLVSKWTASLVPAEDDEQLPDDRKPVKLKPKKESLEDRVKAFLTNLNNEENLDQLMLCVRRQLTKLLLNGTNEMMRTIAIETLEKFKRKASQVKKSKAVASLKSELGAFGLTSYSGSDSEEEASESDSAAPNVNADDDDDNESSDEDIRIEMEKKKHTFQLMLLTRISTNGQQPDEETPATSSSSTSTSTSAPAPVEVSSRRKRQARSEQSRSISRERERKKTKRRPKSKERKKHRKSKSRSSSRSRDTKRLKSSERKRSKKSRSSERRTKKHSAK